MNGFGTLRHCTDGSDCRLGLPTIASMSRCSSTVTHSGIDPILVRERIMPEEVSTWEAARRTDYPANAWVNRRCRRLVDRHGKE